MQLDPQQILCLVEPKERFQMVNYRHLLKDPAIRWAFQDCLLLVGGEENLPAT